MQPNEYMLVFVSLIVGLALAELLSSVHGLVLARRDVDLDWVPLVWAGFVLLLTVNVWWRMFDELGLELYQNYFGFLVLLVGPILVYLGASIILPDPTPDGSTDLWEHHLEHRRWFFGLMVAFGLWAVGTDLLEDGTFPVLGNSIRLAMCAAAAVLGWSRSRAVHAGLTLGTAAALLGFVALFAARIG